MSLKRFAKKALKTYARSKSRSAHSHSARPGAYHPGVRRSNPKAAAANAAVREVGKLLRGR
ncbi:hypothetical protein [Psychromarinibacter sp. S121]|uniref:hypothetical protein n=1 Tax=Psychromarinibacter sp. S121 TaxID=3415127 RepID=UPI003C7E84D5